MRISKKIATAAAALAIAAGLLAPTASAACPYTVGPLGRYIAPAEVRGLYAYGDRVQVWCSDLKDGDDWFFSGGCRNRSAHLRPGPAGCERQRHPGRFQRRHRGRCLLELLLHRRLTPAGHLSRAAP